MSLILNGTTGVPVTTVTGTLPVANGGTGGSTSTGTGAVVLATSPTLVTPALGTPASGTLTNCTGVAAAALPAGSVVQVVSTTKTDVFTTSSVLPTFVSVTGYSVTITPASASNKVLVQGTYTASINTATAHAFLKIQRNGTDIYVGDAAGSRTQAANDIGLFNVRNPSCFSFSILDSPATTSAVTYQAVVSCQTGYTFALNRDSGNDDNIITGRFPSTITVMEIKG